MMSAGFQSTLPVWGATTLPPLRPRWRGISIHAPRVGSDQNTDRGDVRIVNISIHAPRVGSDGSPFKSFEQVQIISIHAPRVGSDGQI